MTTKTTRSGPVGDAACRRRVDSFDHLVRGRIGPTPPEEGDHRWLR